MTQICHSIKKTGVFNNYSYQGTTMFSQSSLALISVSSITVDAPGDVAAASTPVAPSPARVLLSPSETLHSFL